MRRQGRRIGVLGAVVLVLTACSGAGSPTPVPAATSFEEYRTAFCSSWEALFRAIGNPDTGEGSELSDAMDAAISRRDLGQVDTLAARIQGELAAGRRQIAFAAGFGPGAQVMSYMDRLFADFGVLIEAKRAAAPQGLEVATTRSQAAFEATGALDTWRTLMSPESWSALEAARPSGEEQRNCENVPIGL